jgi:hypothetical protein
MVARSGNYFFDSTLKSKKVTRKISRGTKRVGGEEGGGGGGGGGEEEATNYRESSRKQNSRKSFFRRDFITL